MKNEGNYSFETLMVTYIGQFYNKYIIFFVFFVFISGKSKQNKSMDILEIPVTYKNKELSFKARVVRFGYVSHVVVDLFGDQVTIERDEEGNYRALGDIERLENSKLDVDLVKAVVVVLESL